MLYLDLFLRLCYARYLLQRNLQSVYILPFPVSAFQPHTLRPAAAPVAASEQASAALAASRPLGSRGPRAASRNSPPRLAPGPRRSMRPRPDQPLLSSSARRGLAARDL